MTGNEPGAPPRGGARCLLAGALFALTFIVGWLVAITLYGLVVEQWDMVRVRRDFSYDWAFVWAPLFALGCGLVVAFQATRRLAAARVTLLVVTVGLAALLGGIVILGLGGLIG